MFFDKFFFVLEYFGVMYGGKVVKGGRKKSSALVCKKILN